MGKNEFYKDAEVPQEEIDRMKTIEYPTYVSETVLGAIDLTDKKVLDSGAGPNPSLAEFVDRKKGIYVPFDIRGDVLKEMQTKLEAEMVPFYGVRGDVRSLPFGDEAFDVVHQRFVLMNISEGSRKQATEELLRVCKDSLVLLEYNWRTLRSEKHPEFIERFKQIAFKLFTAFSTDPYMGEKLEDFVSTTAPSRECSIERFQRPEDVGNTTELILNLKAFYNAAKNVLKDEAYANDILEMIAELEESPIEFAPPEIVVAVIKK